MSAALLVMDAGVLPYREAWALQERTHERVLSGELKEGALILLEHRPVITIGRRADARRHLLASDKLLQTRGVEVVETDRGGDITFHGPGQLVVYPIIPLNLYGLNLHGYMRLLEEVTVAVLAVFGVEALRVEGCTGVWVPGNQDRKAAADDQKSAPENVVCSNAGLEKICAIGVKLRRWTTLHGLALNVHTDLSFFDMINACGLSRPVTSMQKRLAEKTPPLAEVKAAFIQQFAKKLTAGSSLSLPTY